MTFKKKILVLFPLALGICFYAISLRPESVSLISDENQSWFTPLYNGIYVVVSVYAFPVTFVKGIFFDSAKLVDYTYYLLLTVYSLSWSVVLYLKIHDKKSSRGHAGMALS